MAGRDVRTNNKNAMSAIAAFTFAVLIDALYLMTFARRQKKLVPIVTLFLILLLSGLGVQYWMAPVGPSLLGVSWVPMAIIVIMFALVFAASLHDDGHNNATKDAVLSMKVFTWLLLGLLSGVMLISHW